jgi:hypothetical protein
VPLSSSVRPGKHPVGLSGAPRVSTRSSQIVVPRWGDRVHMLLESIPFRVFTSSRRPGRCAPGPASSRFFAPSTTSPGLAPSAAVRPVPLRFRSQVFSTSQRFPGMSGLRGLVSCRCRPWGFPCGALLLAGIACSSRSRLLPCSSPPPYLRCDARDRVLRVSPTPAPSRGGLDPPGAPTPFPPLASQRLPRRLEPRAPNPPRSGGFGCFEALLPPRGRCARRSGFPSRRGPCSPGLSPLQSVTPVEPQVLL